MESFEFQEIIEQSNRALLNVDSTVEALTSLGWHMPNMGATDKNLLKDTADHIRDLLEDMVGIIERNAEDGIKAAEDDKREDAGMSSWEK